jgi:geranylgeranyl diphosphate synthase type II
MQNISQLQGVFLEYLNEFTKKREPLNLYEPANYILQLGGKRLRPVLTLMSTSLLNGDVNKALPAALSIEVFHNFSLVHDDIMDGAPLRRGKETVHKKWDVNTGILSGDAMLILAYQLYEQYEPETFQALAKLFSKTALEVCEGQQYDVDFETRNDVTIPEYLKMIEYKTAVLVGTAMQMGAIVAKASQEDQKGLYEFGRLLGVAFQLQDDYLDAFGNPETFGKQVGGDIIENKKTYLYLKAIEALDAEKSAQLINLFGSVLEDNSKKIETVKNLFIESGSAEATKQAIKEYTHQAYVMLNGLSIDESKKQLLIEFGNSLMTRKV